MKRTRLADDRLPVDEVAGWLVGEGDVLLGGLTVLTVTRDPMTRRSRLTTSDGAARTLGPEDTVQVVRRAL